jgi:hypothetical protein
MRTLDSIDEYPMIEIDHNSGHPAPPPAGPVDLRYLQQLGLLQKSITQALDTLGNCRPSAAAAAQDPAEADQAFEAALAAAVAGVKASQQLLASALGHSGDSPA